MVMLWKRRMAAWERDEEGQQREKRRDRVRGVQRVGIIISGAVCTLIATADLTNVEHVEFERFDDRLVEALGRVIVVDADG